MPQWTVRLFQALCVMLVMIGAARAARAIRLDCPSRHNIVVSWFNNHLATMKWPENFQIASGQHRGHTRDGHQYQVTSFQNGDDLIWFPASGNWFVFYGDSPRHAEHCSQTGEFSYPVTELPRYNGPLTSHVS